MSEEPISTVDARRRAGISGHTGDEETALALSTHYDPEVRSIALHALDRMRRLDADTVRNALCDPAATVRRRALGLAIAFSEVSIVELLSDPDDSVVEQCAWACGERVPPELNAVVRLSEVAATHEDSLCREAAVAALGAIGDVAGLPAILGATRDKATVRRRAIIALAPFSGADVDRALDLAKNDRDWQVRQAAEELSHDLP